MNGSQRELVLEREDAKRRARQGLLNFITYLRPDYQVNWHHRAMCRALNRAIARRRAGVGSRLIFTMPPRHGKTEIVSRHLPAYLLGIEPSLKFIAASYAATLAEENNRDCQRIIQSDGFRALFPGVCLNEKNVVTDAQGSWLRNSSVFEIVGHRGRYQCAGVGGGLTGKGADAAVVDDPVKDDKEAGSPVTRQRVWDWYSAVLRTRLSPAGIIIITMCMTGDTRVLMADGTEKPLRNIRAGDAIATYENGRLATSTITQWRPQGLDTVFSVRTRSGIVVKANERHPFLVCRAGGLQWVRLRDLRPNDKMMRVTEHTAGSFASSRGVTGPQNASECACRTTTRGGGPTATARHHTAAITDGFQNFVFDTASPKKIIETNWPSRWAGAPFAPIPQGRASTFQRLGMENFVSTTPTVAESSGGFCATNATLFSNTPTPSRYCSTRSIICDPIVEIRHSGTENVYDVEVERTENFIANGVVSHNTRWNMDDLVGRLLNQMADPEADQWEVINLPALNEDGPSANDPRQVGEALWPARLDLPEMRKLQAGNPRIFGALYQQRPAPPKGAVVQRDWWRHWMELPVMDRVAIYADLTFKDKEKGDWCVFQVWGCHGADRYLMHQVRAQLAYTAQRATLRTLAEAYPLARRKGIEDAANAASLVNDLRHEISGLVGIAVRDSKLARAEACAPDVQAGNVYIPDPRRCGWVGQFVQEWAEFPFGAHDDQVDCTSLALNDMHRQGPTVAPLGQTKQSRWTVGRGMYGL